MFQKYLYQNILIIFFSLYSKHYYQSLCFVLHTYTPYSQRESEKITSSNHYILNESSLSFEVSSSLHDATHKNLINGNVFMNGGSLNLNDL